jgi:hypothetical protein
MPKMAVYPMAIGGTLKEKAAILADDAIDRPHSDHLIAPSCRGAGDGITRIPADCSRSNAA